MKKKVFLFFFWVGRVEKMGQKASIEALGNKFRQFWASCV